jgi:hypothetical protein
MRSDETMNATEMNLEKADEPLRTALRTQPSANSLCAILAVGPQDVEPTAKPDPSKYSSRTAWRRALIDRRRQWVTQHIEPIVRELRQLGLEPRGGFLGQVVITGSPEQILAALQLEGVHEAWLDFKINLIEPTMLRPRKLCQVVSQFAIDIASRQRVDLAFGPAWQGGWGLYEACAAFCAQSDLFEREEAQLSRREIASLGNLDQRLEYRRLGIGLAGELATLAIALRNNYCQPSPERIAFFVVNWVLAQSNYRPIEMSSDHSLAFIKVDRNSGFRQLQQAFEGNLSRNSDTLERLRELLRERWVKPIAKIPA